MNGVTNYPSKESALEEAKRFKQYFPYRYVGIVEAKSGGWGVVSGKTKARMNRLSKEGYKVLMLV